MYGASLFAVVHAMITVLRTYLTDFFAPPLCAACKQGMDQRGLLCGACAARISPIVSTTLALTSPYSIKIFAIAAYQDPIKSIILAKSWSSIVASHQLGELVWDMTHIRYVPFDFCVPVPLHWTRYASRGYNQAHEMAQVIARHSGKPVASIVERVRRTPFQSMVPAHERINNVNRAFRLRAHNNSIYRNKHLLIVDDLMTTGATLKAVGLELMKLKPASITAVVAARVV